MDNKHETGASTHTGFPNAADDSRLKSLSLDILLVPRPGSTFYFRIDGNQWSQQGIFDGDIALVDKALSPKSNDLIIWWRDSDFVISAYKDLVPDAEVWGVATAVIHQFRK